MKVSVDHLTNDQPKAFSKREDKKNVNIPWNSRFYFQVGLIVSLLAVFFAMQATLGMRVNPVAYNDPGIDLTEYYSNTYVLEPPVVEPPKWIKKKTVPKIPKITDLIIMVPDSTLDVPDVEMPTTEQPVVAPPIQGPPTAPVDSGPETLNTVEFVPIFPGCEDLGSNQEKIACMSSKINKFIRRNFRTNRFNDLKVGSKQNIYVEFRINKSGDVADVRAIAKHASLKQEAIRTLNKLPKMKPGMQGEHNVSVMYTVPIRFQVVD